ncbi:MAG: hypothetical protein WCC48_11100 [Anaeromyxobacteraceae bacterium]
MKSFPKWVYLLVGVSGVLFYPSAQLVRFYSAAEHFMATAPEIESSLASSVSEVAGKRLVCLRDTVVEGGVTPDDIERTQAPMVRANGRFGEQLSDEMYRVLRLDPDVVRGIRECVSTSNELSQFLSSSDAYEDFCNIPRNLLGYAAKEAEANRTPEEIARVEQEGEPKLREHAAKLEEFRQQFVRARATHEERKVLFRAIAWADILLETVGMACTAAVIWASLTRRRGAAA